MVWADSVAQARDVAERLRRRIADVRVPTGAQPPCRMTASFGVAVVPTADRPSPELLLRRADRLLYAAKLAGRNCVMTDAPPASPDLSTAAQ